MPPPGKKPVVQAIKQFLIDPARDSGNDKNKQQGGQSSSSKPENTKETTAPAQSGQKPSSGTKKPAASEIPTMPYDENELPFVPA